MPNLIDLTGQRFGRLKVIERAKNRFIGKTNQPFSNWLCVCDCGVIKEILANSLRWGNTKSCGCLANELTSKRCKLGYTHTQEYKSWHSMQRRCSDIKNKDYRRYGGRGITVCERWINSFLDFREDMGFAPSLTHSPDRINNDGNYEPSNCRWATQKEQCNNRSTSRKYKTTLSMRDKLNKIRELAINKIIDMDFLKDIIELTS